MGIPLGVICCFSLAFNICSLYLVFVNLIYMCLGVFLPWVYPLWDSLGFLDLCDYFLPHFGEVFSYYLLEYFLMAFLFVFFFWDSYDSNVGAFHIVPEFLEVVLTSFDSFFFFPLCFIYFHHFSCTSLILSSASLILLLVPSRVFFISFIALFIFN